MNVLTGRNGIVLVAVSVALLIAAMVTRQTANAQSHKAVAEVTTRRLSELQNHMQNYEIEDDKVVFERYARVYDRVVRYPNGESFAFDVWGRNWKTETFAVVIIVPYDVKSKTVTLIKEYNPAHHRFVYGFPTGMISKDKHKNPLDAAMQELDEEAQLTCNKWINLLSEEASAGIPQVSNHSTENWMEEQSSEPLLTIETCLYFCISPIERRLFRKQDKYQRESVYMYLCVDEEEDDHPNDRDSEEIDLYVENGVTIPELKALLRAGTFQSNNVAAAYLAFDELTQRGYHLE